MLFVFSWVCYLFCFLLAQRAPFLCCFVWPNLLVGICSLMFERVRVCLCSIQEEFVSLKVWFVLLCWSLLGGRVCLIWGSNILLWFFGSLLFSVWNWCSNKKSFLLLNFTFLDLMQCFWLHQDCMRTFEAELLVEVTA